MVGRGPRPPRRTFRWPPFVRGHARDDPLRGVEAWTSDHTHRSARDLTVRGPAAAEPRARPQIRSNLSSARGPASAIGPAAPSPRAALSTPARTCRAPRRSVSWPWVGAAPPRGPGWAPRGPPRPPLSAVPASGPLVVTNSATSRTTAQLGRHAPLLELRLLSIRAWMAAPDPRGRVPTPDPGAASGQSRP